MSHIRSINPINLEYDELIKLIRKVFGLNEYPYEDMDSYIILLAFIPKCNVVPDLINELNQKYGTCDHQTLEFYGDRILYGVIANIIYDFFGLTMNPHFYTTLNSILTKNRLLTDIMLDKQACEFVRSGPYVIREGAKFHNICSDSFEALIGAIFIYLKSKRLDYMTFIKNWILKNTGLPYVLKQYLNNVGFPDKTVYVVNDRDSLLTSWINGYEQLKKDLINNRESVDENTYQYLLEEYSKAQKVYLTDFSFTGIIVNPNVPIYKIFEYLKWSYSGPLFIDNEYVIKGNPGGLHITIGSGSSSVEAINNATKYLFARGYVVPMKTISLHYSTPSTKNTVTVTPIMPQTRTTTPITPRPTNVTQTTTNTPTIPRITNVTQPIITTPSTVTVTPIITQTRNVASVTPMIPEAREVIPTIPQTNVNVNASQKYTGRNIKRRHQRNK